jgi:hypothetical protein
LIRARILTRKFDLDIYGSSIGNPMSHNVAFTVMSDVHDRAVLCIELPYRVVTGYTSVLTEGYDDLIL